jgi:hypothetical protein
MTRAAPTRINLRATVLKILHIPRNPREASHAKAFKDRAHFTFIARVLGEGLPMPLLTERPRRGALGNCVAS